MSESGFVDEAPRPGTRGTRGRRQPADPRPPKRAGAAGPGRWVLPGFLTIGLLLLPAFAAWVYLGGVHADDIQAHDELVHEFVLVDRNVPPLSHGDSEPCASVTEGSVTRSYSRSASPTALELREFLTGLGWTITPAEPAEPARPLLIHLTRPTTVPDHTMTVLLQADTLRSFGVTLTATSSASSLACLVRG